MAANSSTILTSRLSKVEVDDVLVLRMTSLTINPATDEHSWGDSDSGSYTNRIGTRIGCTGSVGGKFDAGQTPYSIVRESQIVELILWLNTTLYWALPCALITSYTDTVDQDGKVPIEWAFDFGNDGVYYAPGEAGAPTKTYPTG